MYDVLPVSLFRSGAPALRCTICCRCHGQVLPQHEDVRFVAGVLVCCRCLGLEVVPQHEDIRFVACVLVSERCPSMKMYDLFSVSLSPALRCTIRCRCLGSGASARRCTICCRCLGFEVVPQHEDVRFVAGVLVSKWCPSTEMYDLLPVSWSRSGALALRCTMRCQCLGLEVVPVLVSKWCPSSKMYDLLPVSWSRSGAPTLRCTIC